MHSRKFSPESRMNRSRLRTMSPSPPHSPQSPKSSSQHTTTPPNQPATTDTQCDTQFFPSTHIPDEEKKHDDSDSDTDDAAQILDIITNSPKPVAKRRGASAVRAPLFAAEEASNEYADTPSPRSTTSSSASPRDSNRVSVSSRYDISVPLHVSKTNQTQMLQMTQLTRLCIWQMHEFQSAEDDAYEIREDLPELDQMDVTGEISPRMSNGVSPKGRVSEHRYGTQNVQSAQNMTQTSPSLDTSPPCTPAHKIHVDPVNLYCINSRTAIITPLNFIPIQDYKQREASCDALMVYEIKNENLLVDMAVKNGAALRVRVSESVEDENVDTEDNTTTSTTKQLKKFPNSSSCSCLRMKKVVQDLESNPFGKAVDGIIVDAKYVDTSKCVFLPPPRKKKAKKRGAKDAGDAEAAPTSPSKTSVTSTASSMLRQFTSYFSRQSSTETVNTEEGTCTITSSATTTTSTTTSSPQTTSSPTQQQQTSPQKPATTPVLVFSPTYISTRIKQHNRVTEDDILRIISGFARGEILTRDDAKFIIEETLAHFSQTPNVLELTIDQRGVVVVGDLHGNLQDMLYIFQERGLPCNQQPYIFLGDFVDRGSHCPEVILLAFALKLACPSSVYILRGNHESKSVNQLFEQYNQGWISDFVAKYDQSLFERIEETFNYMPLMAIANERISFVHGGIGAVNSLQAIRKLNRISDVQTGGVLSALLWSDPVEQPYGFSKSSRGTGIFNYGPDITEGFFKRNRLEYLVRSHTVVEEGYRLHHNGRVVTIFSCSSYNSNPNQRGSILLINEALEMRIWRFHSKYLDESEMIPL